MTDISRLFFSAAELLPSLTLLGDLEVLLTAQNHSLQHLMGRDVSFEVPGVPQLPHQLSKPLNQQKHDIPRRTLNVLVILFLQEVIPQGRDVGQCLRDTHQ